MFKHILKADVNVQYCLCGEGMLSMRNALAVALGEYAGGIFNSWLVAFSGFKADWKI